MDSFDPFTRPFWITIGMSVLCGAVVGLERQLRGKPVGVRTSVLICLSTAVFIRLGAAVAGEGTDASRVLGQLVTGVGFLGAGVILTREGMVTGVTTAAVIWALAAIGAAVGLGHPAGGLAVALVTVTLLTGVELIEAALRGLRNGPEQEP